MNQFQKVIMDAYREGREDQHNKKTMDWAKDAYNYYYETFEFPLQEQKIDELKIRIDRMREFLEWNIFSIKSSPSSRESVITLKVYEELLLKLNAGGGI